MLTLESLKGSDPRQVVTIVKSHGQVSRHSGLPLEGELGSRSVEMDTSVRIVVQATRGSQASALIRFLPVDGASSGWHELPGGKHEGRPSLDTLEAELFEEVGVPPARIAEHRFLGHTIEVRPPEKDPTKLHYVPKSLVDGEDTRPVRVKVSSGFLVTVDEDLDQVSPAFAPTETGRLDFRPIRVLVPTIPELCQILNTAVTKTRLLRERVFAQWACEHLDKH